MTFTPLKIPSADSTSMDVDAAIVLGTENCLAVQRMETESHGSVYRALHVPTGSVWTRYAFSDPELARDALVAFWNCLGAEDRIILQGDDLAAIDAEPIRRPFENTFVERSDVFMARDIPEVNSGG